MEAVVIEKVMDSEAVMDRIKMNEFSLGDVLLTEDYCENAFEKEVEYLFSFDVDRLLAGFRETAGLSTKGKSRYPGWENMLIGGHCVGHYVSACANSLLSPNCSEKNKKRLLEILSEMMDGFEECQNAVGTGFIFGAKLLDSANIEKQFDNVEKGQSNIITQAWVPWYTMHKIIEGLLGAATIDSKCNAGSVADFDEYRAISEKAKSILLKLTDWIYARASSWNYRTRKTVLSIEYGGMNDCLYSVYLLTGSDNARKSAHIFDDEDLFKKISGAKIGDNILAGRHANTTIPKFVGALNRYIAVGDEKYLEFAKKFWDLVTESHTYANGGNSTWEHFGEDNNLYSKLSNCNCETCNSYNMLKLTKMLFMTTGEKKYADWYEQTFINSILSSQNPENGMTTYFQPMASGYFKVYGSPFNHFWCCTGTGMENFSKLGESFYFTKDDTIFVNQYMSSEVAWKEKNVKIIQKSSVLSLSESGDENYSMISFKKLEQSEDGHDSDLHSDVVGDSPRSPSVSNCLNETDLSADISSKVKVAFRIPEWITDASDVKILLNGKKCNFERKDGYAIIFENLDYDSEIKILLPMKIQAVNLPDKKDAWAFKYGPVLLSAQLGSDEKKTAINGVNVTIPERILIEEKYVPSKTDVVTVKDISAEDFISNINNYLVRVNQQNQNDGADSEKMARFKLNQTDSNLIYIPHYLQCNQRYGLYFRFLDENASNQNMEDKLSQSYINANKIDVVQAGYGQYENDDLHKMTESGNGSRGQTYMGTSRWALANGSFSYSMIVDKEGTDLVLTFNPSDNGKSILIKAGESVIYEEKLHVENKQGFYKVNISLDKELLERESKKALANGKVVDVVQFTFSGMNGEQSAQICEFVYTMKQ